MKYYEFCEDMNSSCSYLFPKYLHVSSTQNFLNGLHFIVPFENCYCWKFTGDFTRYISIPHSVPRLEVLFLGVKIKFLYFLLVWIDIKWLMNVCWSTPVISTNDLGTYIYPKNAPQDRNILKIWWHDRECRKKCLQKE